MASAVAPEDNPGGKLEIVLDVRGGVRELGAEPVGLDGAQGEVLAEDDIDAAAYAQGEAARRRRGGKPIGKFALEAVSFPDESLSES